MEKVNRREFIVGGSMLLGGTVGIIGLGGSLLSPVNALAENVKFPESSCGREKVKGDRILIAYHSYCGSTGGVAESIGRVFCERGAASDVLLMSNVKDLTPYKAAVIGSAVRSSSWWPDAIKFVEMHQGTLSRIPVAYFLTCLTLFKSSDRNRVTARSYMDPVLKAVPGVKPVDMGFFAGALNYDKLNIMYRLIMKSKMKKKGVPEGDFRDWSKIRSWADQLYERL